MSWNNNIIKYGSGPVEFRLKITGLPTEFVTNTLMNRTFVGSKGELIKRRTGLRRSGLTFSEKVILPESKLEIEGNTFVIDDIDNAATEAFNQSYRKRGQFSTLEDGGFLSDSGSIFNSDDPFSVGSAVWIDHEAFVVHSVFSSSFSHTVQHSASRGAYGTRPTYHYALGSDNVEFNLPVVDYPFQIENQRVYLYAYSEGDDLTGDGVLIWKGIVSEDATFDGMSWTVASLPITSIWERDFGIDAEKIEFRGIDVTGQNFLAEFQLRTTSSITLTSFNILLGGSGVTRTFFDDPTASDTRTAKEKYLDYLNSQIPAAASAAGWTDSLPSFIFDSKGYLVVTYTTEPSPATPKLMLVRFRSQIADDLLLALDNLACFTLRDSGWNVPYIRDPSVGDTFDYEEYDGPFSVTAGTQYYFPTTDVFPNQLTILSPLNKRYYLYSPAGSFVNTISFVNEISIVNADEESIEFSNVETFNTIDQYLEVDNFRPERIERGTPRDPTEYNLFLVVINNDHNISASRRFEARNIVDFIEECVDLAPQFAPLGVLPLFYEDDFDIADMRREFNEAVEGTELEPLKYRVYRIQKPNRSFEEFIQEEFKLFGFFPKLTSENKISFTKINLNANSFTEFDHVFDSSNILTDDSYPGISTNTFGLYNATRLYTEYDYESDEHTGPQITQLNADSIALNGGKIKYIEISPFSREWLTVSRGEFETYIGNVLAAQTFIYNSKYKLISIDVPMSMFSASIGDTVSVDSKQLPVEYSPDGQWRGTQIYYGRIIKRQFDLEQGFGNLWIFVIGSSNSVGEGAIAPIIVPLSASEFSSGIVDIYVDQNKSRLENPETDYIRLMQPNDTIEFREWDTFTPAVHPGTLTTIQVVGPDLVARIEFDSGITPATVLSNPTNWRINFGRFLNDLSELSENQQKFAYVSRGNVTPTKKESVASSVNSEFRKKIKT